MEIAAFANKSRQSFACHNPMIIIPKPAVTTLLLDALGSGKDPVRMLGGQINLGSRISCTRDFVYVADARWTGRGSPA